MFAQATPQIQAPVGGYVLVPQPQRMNYIAQAPLMIQMPIIQKPLQPAIPYEKFLPPTSLQNFTNFTDMCQPLLCKLNKFK